MKDEKKYKRNESLVDGIHDRCSTQRATLQRQSYIMPPTLKLRNSIRSLLLRRLQNRLQLRRLHDVSPDLQLARHEQLLRIRVARDQLAKVLVGQYERHCVRQPRYLRICVRHPVLPSAFCAPSGFGPLPTLPSFFRSMCQESVLPSLFFSSKPKMAPPRLMASFFCCWSSCMPWSMRSKAAEEGNASVEGTVSLVPFTHCLRAAAVISKVSHTIFETHDGGVSRMTRSGSKKGRYGVL